MADNDNASQDFNLRDLRTSSVVITPTNAQVARVIENIQLQPGSNLIEVTGLSPTIDPGSVKIDGYGKASISSVTVERIRNPEHFRDVYDSDSENDDDRPDSKRLPDKPAKLQELERRVRQMEADMVLLDEDIRNANVVVASLEHLTRTTNSKENLSADAIEARINTYADVSQRQARLVQDAREKKVPLIEELPKLKEEVAAARRAYKRDTKEQRKELKRAMEKWRRAKQSQRKAKQERYEERAKFWPRNVYKISVLLEGYDEEDGPAKGRAVSLGLSYVTTDACWTPIYDINIDSESQSGTLVYRAEISNTTSETWRETRVTLSTSKTSFTGLGDPIPELRPWNLRLGQSNNFNYQALVSQQEIAEQQKITSSLWKVVQHRSELFGVVSDDSASESSSDEMAFGMSPTGPPPPAPRMALSGTAVEAKRKKEAVFDGRARGSIPFGSSPAPSGPPAPVTAAFGAGPIRASRSMISATRDNLLESEGFGASAPSADSYSAQQQMSTAEGAWEETGLTASWELGGGAGGHTIGPSSSKRKFRVATLDLADLELRHVCVPKLRAAAFLTARLRNPSEQTILAGQAGLTLDGTFLGSLPLERIAPGAAITVSLGIDESVAVEYAKPVERRNLSTGIIKQDASVAFKRYVTLRHTQTATAAAGKEGKAPAPIVVVVRDQIPVALDERIRLELTSPRGLRSIGDVVRAGAPVYDETTTERAKAVPKAGKARDETWGSAEAKLAKDGKIEWTVKLNPGNKVALPLEYEVKHPAGQGLLSD